MRKDFNPKNNLIGKKFGRLLVVEYSHKVDGNYYYKCLCECGTEVVKSVKYLLDDCKNPHMSCGCWHREILNKHFTTHGMSYSKTYKVWIGIKNRCYSPNASEYENYGGRGIKMCDRWLNSYKNFLEDMGEKPEGMSIDRIDNNGDYTPENCRWTDRETQMNNTRKNVYVEYNGETKTLSQWCRIFSMNFSSARKGLEKNYTFDEIVSKYKNRRGIIGKRKK